MTLEIVTLKDHNVQTYENIKELFTMYKRVAVVQATGTGKSFLIGKLIEDNIDKKICVLSPSKYINRQFEDTFPGLFKNVEFRTYSKVSFYSDDDFKYPQYDIIILDEFHRLGAKKWGGAVKRLLESNPGSKILGATATHIRYLDDEKDMLKILFNNVCANKMTLKKAIDDGIVPKPRLVSSIFSISKDIENIEDKINKSFATSEQKDDMVSKLEKAFRYFNSQKGVDKILKKYIERERKIIIFCESIKHINSMKKNVEGWIKAGFKEDVYTYEVHSYQKDASSQMKKFEMAHEEGFHLLFCVNKLNEGLHIKDTNCAIFLRNTTSPIVFYQQLGRVLSASSSSSPLIFDFVNNSRRICSYKIQKGIKSTGAGVTLDEVFETFDVADECEDILELLSEIENNIEPEWDEMYLRLVDFYNTHGHCIVKREQSVSLSRWCIRQRQREEFMDTDKKNRLNEINFCWNILDTWWSDMYDNLVQFKEKHGHADVSRCHGDPALYEWVKSQRDKKRSGTLAERRISKLNEIGLNWRFQEERNEKHWNEMFNKLLQYKEENSHVDVPRLYSDSTLANWVCTQRKTKAKGKMMKNREDKLNSVGFSWVLPFKRRYDKKEG